MRLLHAADLHLGFRACTRLAPNGLNQRELDVARTFTTMIDRMIALEPDVVVIAGDVFHVVRASNHAITAAYAGFARLVAALPQTIVVMVAGNHDIGKASDLGCILPLFAHLGVHVVERNAMRLRFPDRELSILGVPDAPAITRPSLRPDRTFRRNVLVLHGEAAGVTQGGADRRASLTEISPEELAAPDWDYVALGHYHQYEHVAPNVVYSGSIDFTSSNIWGEIATPKGFVERDLDTGAETFHALPPSRRVIDLPTIAAHELTAPEIDGAIRAALESVDGGMDDAIVRLVVEGVSRDIGRALDGKAMREYKRRCLHLNLDVRRPDVIALESEHGERVETVRKRRPSLTEMLLNTISDAERFPLLADVDRGALAALGAKYLDQAGDAIPSDLGPTESTESTEPTKLTKQLTESLQRGAA